MIAELDPSASYKTHVHKDTHTHTDTKTHIFRLVGYGWPQILTSN